MPAPPHERLDAPAERALRARLERWARSSLGVRSCDFSDVYQSAWRKLLQGERHGRETRNLELALRWAIHNSWLEECRRRRRKPFLTLDESALIQASCELEADPARRIEAREQIRAAVRAIMLMGERSGRIVFMRRVLGFAPQEVCEAVGVTRRTYRAEQARAGGALRALRRDAGGMEG